MWPTARPALLSWTTFGNLAPLLTGGKIHSRRRAPHNVRRAAIAANLSQSNCHDNSLGG
jgi:hypothetical protein